DVYRTLSTQATEHLFADEQLVAIGIRMHSEVLAIAEIDWSRRHPEIAGGEHSRLVDCRDLQSDVGCNLLVTRPSRQIKMLRILPIGRSGEDQDLIVRLNQSHDMFFESPREVGRILIGGRLRTPKVFGCQVPGAKPRNRYRKHSEHNDDIDSAVPDLWTCRRYGPAVGNAWLPSGRADPTTKAVHGPM